LTTKAVPRYSSGVEIEPMTPLDAANLQASIWLLGDAWQRHPNGRAGWRCACPKCTARVEQLLRDGRALLKVGRRAPVKPS
jgi:hypothetical protein